MKRKLYISPDVKIVVLDNEISLALQSTPPTGPDESYNNFSLSTLTKSPFPTT